MDQPKTPLVSIIIPAFNRARLIHNTLNSLLAQNYQNWEGIIVDDGSTDQTATVVEQYICQDKRFRLFKRTETPKGAPKCRNIGLQRSNGKYIVFLDSDDILFKNALNERVHFLETNKTLDFCVSNGIKGPFPLDPELKYKLISTYKGNAYLEEFFNFTPPWLCLNPTFHREALLRANIEWDTNLLGYQDVDFHIQTILAGLKFEYTTSEPDCLWNAHLEGNIGRFLQKEGRFFAQKIYIYNKYQHRPLHEINPLITNILKSYPDLRIPNKKLKGVLSLIQQSEYPMKPIDYKLLSFYRFSFTKKIPLLPRIISKILKLKGAEIFTTPIVNSHFLKADFQLSDLRECDQQK